MTKITINSDCGNSSKKEFLKKINIAFAQADSDFLIESVTDDIVWEMVGDKTIEGKEDFAAVLEEMKEKAASELLVEQILTHGREGAVNGVITASSGNKYAFSDFYKFRGAKGAKIKRLTSYVIKL